MYIDGISFRNIIRKLSSIVGINLNLLQESPVIGWKVKDVILSIGGDNIHVRA